MVGEGLLYQGSRRAGRGGRGGQGSGSLGMGGRGGVLRPGRPAVGVAEAGGGQGRDPGGQGRGHMTHHFKINVLLYRLTLNAMLKLLQD